MADDISPLAQRLAEAYNVDLAKLREKQLEGKITARSVLDYLNAADRNTLEKDVPDSLSEDSTLKKSLLKDRASSGRRASAPGAATPAKESTVVADVVAEPASNPVTPADGKATPKKELKQEKPKQKEFKQKERKEETRLKEPERKELGQKEPVQPPPSASTPGSSAEAVADTVALAKARAQLQVTAKVHQQALMQVGSLREQNTLLEAELELLREAEAQARLQLEAFQKHDEPLEVEVEPARRWRAFAWLRKLFS